MADNAEQYHNNERAMAAVFPLSSESLSSDEHSSSIMKAEIHVPILWAIALFTFYKTGEISPIAPTHLIFLCCSGVIQCIVLKRLFLLMYSRTSKTSGPLVSQNKSNGHFIYE